MGPAARPPGCGPVPQRERKRDEATEVVGAHVEERGQHGQAFRRDRTRPELQTVEGRRAHLRLLCQLLLTQPQAVASYDDAFTNLWMDPECHRDLTV
jgi:hypothetical protein